MKLVHLGAVGPQVPPASLEFASRLTVIYGASEAGKSYIGEAIDYVLGASKLRYIPESDGYQDMLLTLDFEGDVLTFSRNLRGGKISVFEGDLRSVPDYPPFQKLAASHKKGVEDTISHFLLDRLGLAGSVLRKNLRNETITLSFRHLAHLVIVGEERMHSRISPVESGNYTTRTIERSTLKLLLEAEDDSGLDAGEDPAAFRRVNRAQLKVLNRAIAQASAQLDGVPERQECTEMLARVNQSIQSHSESVSAPLAEREQALAELNDYTKQRNLQARRADEASVITERFSLLDTQYATDLQRLEMVKSAGTLLGYFDAESCVFCGANVEYQHRDHAIYETVQLAESIDEETSRTVALREDLATTLAGIRYALQDSNEKSLEATANILQITTRIAEIESQVGPVQSELTSLMERRSDLERWITLWGQVEELHILSSSVAQEQPDTADAVSPGIGKQSLDKFSAKLQHVLSAWNVPGSDKAEFTVEKVPDVVLEGRPRANRGKGIRSVLHAGFSAALGEYCLENELPHPGFMVLDTPVLTYRDADNGATKSSKNVPLLETEEEEEEEGVTQTVAQAFYDYLSVSSVQSVVLENQTPPNVLAEGCKIEYFSGTESQGRAGFYPALA